MQLKIIISSELWINNWLKTLSPSPEGCVSQVENHWSTVYYFVCLDTVLASLICIIVFDPRSFNILPYKLSTVFTILHWRRNDYLLLSGLLIDHFH
jgi:hypothetical protein